MLPERVRLHHAASRFLYRPVLFAPGPTAALGMIKKPLFIKPVNQIIIAVVKSFFPSEKDIQPAAGALIRGFFITTAELVYPLFPGEAAGQGRISVKKMIGYNDP
jgi:hypothetical protein